MKLAAVINEDNFIVPIVEGATLRIYETQTKQISDLENPAPKLKEGRRGAALALARQHGAEAFAAPPQTFCELSYEKAQQEEIVFYNLESPQPFDAFLVLLEQGAAVGEREIASEHVAPSAPSTSEPK
ncbi:hypothetical protein SAMN05421663_108111 [Terribacillus halophilus]|uniref:Uncharacterized protein n=1 Tax=Terribacillus halophilus TaxID=361279 RepID=A0A1G6TAN7_9BACI|nr:hypothetical protein [Terribacillus halophilus]SDD26079.1 hypothetical protein SAMN05421663_108111 [Terribacillus halophilus]